VALLQLPSIMQHQVTPLVPMMLLAPLPLQSMLALLMMLALVVLLVPPSSMQHREQMKRLVKPLLLHSPLTQ